MDLYEACENGNEERVVELLIFGEAWMGMQLAARGPVARRHSSIFSAGQAESSSALRADSALALDVAASATNAFMAAASVAATSVGLMLSAREMLQARGTAGRTPLHAACMGGQVNVVRLLLGEPCMVYFTSRTKEETKSVLAPLQEEHEKLVVKPPRDNSSNDSPPLFEINMATKDGGDDLVPVALVQFTTEQSIAPQDLLEGKKHVDDFGNTALQCVSCFGCGSSERHIDDGLEITKHLLIHGDQPNLPKFADKWTPLHWSAYNGNHEQVAILLNPSQFIGESRKIGKTQFSVPLLVNSDNLFPVDTACRRGLVLLRERAELRRDQLQGDRSEYAKWRLRLSHVDTLKHFTEEFLENASHLVRYVNEMNERLPVLLLRDKQVKKKRFTCTDGIRYGQHLLYWAGCFGLVSEVRALLELKMEVTSFDSLNDGGAQSGAIQGMYLQPLYVCSCEENKRQSVLHAVASHGQQEIVSLLLSKMLYDQQHPSLAIISHFQNLGSPKDKTFRTKKNVITPSNGKDNEALVNQTNGAGTGITSPSKGKLNVLELIDVGWRNYRNETPLFLAVLYLQQSVATIFARLLTPESLVWELANCNVEGSYIHHVADDHSRQVLGINSHQKMVCAEYVMLFDGIRKKQFKETVIETIREESPLAPPLVVTRAGKRVSARSWYSLLRKPTQTDYLVIGATESVLMRHAGALQLKIKHRGSTVRSKYNTSTPQLFEPFRSLQRQQVVMDIIQKNVHLKKHVTKGNLKAIFPLHDASGCKNIMRNWVYTDERRCVFQPFFGNSMQQFLFEKRTHQYEMLWPLLTYFGEKHAFYYAFVVFYSVWLLLIAIPGAICQLLSYFADIYFLSPLYAVIVSIWATLLVERWKRKKSEIQMNFGNFKRNRNEESPEFYGDFQVETIEKSIVDVKFPKSLQLLRIYCGIPVLLTMASFVVIIFISVKVMTASSDIVFEVPVWLPTLLLPYVIPFLNAVSMLILDNLYTKVALALTLWENHRTVWQYESMLATKLFWFKFLNAFISLFWVAFVERDAAALRKQLIIVMGVRQIWYMFTRNIYPLLLVQRRWKSIGIDLKTADGKKPWFTFTREWYSAEQPGDADYAHTGGKQAATQSVPSLVLMQEMMFPPDFLMGKQMEIVLQFGYITMFVSVLPAGPLLALIGNVVNTRLDVICCTQVKQRPPFESETEVSTFMSILEFMSFAAVTVNCAVLFFTTQSDLESLLLLGSKSWKNDSAFYLKKLWILLVIEHIVLGAKALLSLTIDDAATWVQNDEDRNDDEEKKNSQRDHETARPLEERLLRTLDADEPSGEAQEILGITHEALVDELLTEALDWKKRDARRLSMSTSSALNRVLAEKYSDAVKERDRAVLQEKMAQRQLLECIQQLEQQRSMQKPLGNAQNTTLLSNGDESAPPAAMANSGDVNEQLFNVQEAGSHRQCLLCRLVRLTSVDAAKRCLTCRVFTCLQCDEILHLDDLGMKEATHFRLNIPKLVQLEVLSSSSFREDLSNAPSDIVSTTGLAKDNEFDTHVLNELRKLVKEFVMVYNEKRGPVASALLLNSYNTTPTQLHAGRVYDKCMESPHLVLRYLRNERRRRRDHG